MAKQTGIIKLKGTIGDISFYKTADGHLARAKGGIEASRIANDPVFQRTRENGSEFGRAGKGGKVLRNAIRILLENAKGKRIVSRLTKELLKVIKTDTVNARGERTIQDGDFALIENFDFNDRAKLASTLFASYGKSYDRLTGEVELSIASFTPRVRIAAPQGTTHFKIVLGASDLDFINGTSTFENDETAILPYDNIDTTAIDLTAVITEISTLPVIIVLGIEFYQEVNGEMYPLKNGSYNALSIITADNE